MWSWSFDPRRLRKYREARAPEPLLSSSVDWGRFAWLFPGTADLIFAFCLMSQNAEIMLKVDKLSWRDDIQKDTRT